MWLIFKNIHLKDLFNRWSMIQIYSSEVGGGNLDMLWEKSHSGYREHRSMSKIKLQKWADSKTLRVFQATIPLYFSTCNGKPLVGFKQVKVYVTYI